MTKFPEKAFNPLFPIDDFQNVEERSYKMYFLYYLIANCSQAFPAQ